VGASLRTPSAFDAGRQRYAKEMEWAPIYGCYAAALASRRSAPLKADLLGRGYHQGMSWPDRIVIDPEILAGKPVVRGTRLAAEFILDLLAAGEPEADVLANYPGLTHDDILACLAYASHLAHEYKAYPLPV
jgi:uncharacterized protein (DUF433 family)